MYFMELAKCYLECAKLEKTLENEFGSLKIFSNKISDFKIQIIKIFSFENPTNSNNYIVMIKNKHLDSSVEKYMDYKTFIENYF